MHASGNNHYREHFSHAYRLTIYALVAISYAIFSVPASAGDRQLQHHVDDIDYGLALFQYFQQSELAAITRLLVAEKKNRTREQVDEASLLLADLYYRYGLYHQSQQLFTRLLEDKESPLAQNRIWFNLARLKYEQGAHKDARYLLANIQHRLPGKLEDERLYVLANLFLEESNLNQAVNMISRIDETSVWRLYARYNQAIYLLDGPEHEQGSAILDEMGQMIADTPEKLALRDRANLSLGLKQLRMAQLEAGLASLLRIRLEGPFSHPALLATGWARFRLNRFDKALILWQKLMRDNIVDAATQEAILAIPSGYLKIGQDKLAAAAYVKAVELLDSQFDLLNRSLAEIRNNRLVSVLRDHAILKSDNIALPAPTKPVTGLRRQLHLLMASAGFQVELKRLQHLLDIDRRLGLWAINFPALELMLSERRQRFRLKLPELRQTTSFERLSSLSRSTNEYANEIKRVTLEEDYLALANSAEKQQLSRLARVKKSLQKLEPLRDTTYHKDMHRLLRGILSWRFATEFPQRLWHAKKQLIGLQRALLIAKRRADSLRQISHQSNQTFIRFEQRIDGQQSRINALGSRVKKLIQRQQQRINQLAINELQRQQRHIKQLRRNAGFALARLYDRLAIQP